MCVRLLTTAYVTQLFALACCLGLTCAGCQPIILKMRAFMTLKAAVFVLILCGTLISGSLAGEPPDAKTKSERRVTLQVTDVPINEVLNILVKSVSLEIRGTVPSQERITAQFSNVTLEEALGRIMRGYNYVLVQPEGSTRPLLVVMNRIERSMQRDSAPFVPAGGVPVSPPGAMPAQDALSRVGQQTQSGPQQVQTTLPPGAGEVANPLRPESQPNMPGVPGGIPTVPLPTMPQGAVPPGTASGTAGMPTGPGNIPTGSLPPPSAFPPPGVTVPLPQGGDVTGPVPTPPPQSPQPSSEPARIMTPFGERPAE